MLSQTPRRRRGRGGMVAAVWAASVAFLALFALLSVRLASGRDPAIVARSANSHARPRVVVVRRVYERVVVVHLPASAPPQRSTQTSVSSGAVSAAPAPVVTRTS
jgi:hypothetical protein